MTSTAVTPQDPWSQVSEVLRLVRSGAAQTRPELADATRLGRNIITSRIAAASDLGLVEPAGTGRSRGGRAADVWRFRGEAGRVLVGMVGASRFRVAVADLDGRVLGQTDVDWPVSAGPVETCERMAREMDRLLADAGGARPWGICIGLPAPVNVDTGESVDPVAPTEAAYRWPREFGVRQWFTDRYSVPTWLDAVSNLMALGAAAAEGAARDLIFVRIGTGLGSGIVSQGRLYRGATWLAGELNHVTVEEDPDRICLCGRIGCLDTYAGGWTMLREARAAASSGRSPYLADAGARAELTLDTIADGAQYGDAVCIDIVRRAAEALGRVLAGIVTWYNPAEVVIGGFRFAQNDLFRGIVDRTLRLKAMAASVAGLTVRAGDPDQAEGIVGAVELVVEEILSPAYLASMTSDGAGTG